MANLRRERQGIYRHGAGWRAAVSRGYGVVPSYRHFPIDTSVKVMQDWRADEKARLRLKRKTRSSAGTFVADARAYLTVVRALTTHQARERDIERWIAIFGTRRRDSITSSEIRGWRDTWMKQPRPGGQLPYAASTINHWLRALSNLWTVLDGRRAPNPVRDVPEVTEPDPLPRALSFDTIDAILERIARRGRPVKGESTKGTLSKTHARLRVVMYTGLTYAQLALLTPADVDLKGATMLVRSRQKGSGSKPQRLPLHPEAVKAFQAFSDLRCWGRFSGASVRKTFRVAAAKARKAGYAVPEDVRPYDLRHSWGTAVVAATGSLEAAKDLLSHRSTRTTRRYALGAADELLRAQVLAVSIPQKLIPPDGTRNWDEELGPTRNNTDKNGAPQGPASRPRRLTLVKNR